ncbi:MAG: GNAT family N-acetyltransferase [Flavisolibacter sp.]|nr:GNAT family N-acetyltransferase [Flavisolibacter sp.]
MKAASSQQNYILETKRLRLRKFTLNDFLFIIELLNSPEWIEFIGDKNVRTKTQAIEYLENGPIKSYAQNGYGLSLVETKDGLPIGMCGIIKRDSLENPDIGFAFLKEFTGKGYAYEMASATLSYAMDELKISKISAITLPHNTRSINLLEKIGMKLIKSFTSQNGKELLLFEK